MNFRIARRRIRSWRWAARNTEDRLAGHCVPVLSIVAPEGFLLAAVIVQLHIRVITIENGDRLGEIVTGSAWQVRIRIERLQFRGLRRDPVSGNHIARKSRT